MAKLCISIFCLVVLRVSLVYATEVADKIDQAIVIAATGRMDLATIELRRLLQGGLTSEEQATVLYNLASLYARDDKYEEALDTIGKVWPDHFGVAVRTSPLLAVCITYDRALFAVQVVKDKMQAQNEDLSQLEELKYVLDRAKEALLQGLSLINSVSSAVRDEAPTVSAMIHMLEELAKQKQKLAQALFTYHVKQLNKEELINEFSLFLYDGYMELSTLLAFKASTSYVEAFKGQFRRFKVYNDQLLLLLRAPGAPLQVEILHYFAEQIEALQTALNRAGDDVEKILAVYTDLCSWLRVMTAQVDLEDMEQLFVEWNEATVMQQILPQGTPLEGFWAAQEQKRSELLHDYVNRWQRLSTKMDSPEVAALWQLIDRGMQIIKDKKSTAAARKIAFIESILALATFQRGALVERSTPQGVVKAVDAALAYQNILIYLTAMNEQTSDINQQKSIAEDSLRFVQWQKYFLGKTALLTDLQKQQAAKDLVVQAQKVVSPEPAALSTAQLLLARASRLLHKEQNEQNQNNAENSHQATGAAPQQQMERKSLKLSPETSIRLLQEMFRDDMSLEEPKKYENKEVSRPW
ncbi:MAG: hypothetical protein JSR46_01820 [Verrucomicrobia bacterium]|nr:hypothetical protein [Verrucomicrobiota bacterium]